MHWKSMGINMIAPQSFLVALSKCGGETRILFSRPHSAHFHYVPCMHLACAQAQTTKRISQGAGEQGRKSSASIISTCNANSLKQVNNNQNMTKSMTSKTMNISCTSINFRCGPHAPSQVNDISNYWNVKCIYEFRPAMRMPRMRANQSTN